jgi:hypothetical protein
MVVNATTTARVKALLGDGSSTNDTLYGTLVESVSREIEKFIGYELEQKSRVEIYSPELNEHLVFLRTIPVVSITQVRVAAEGVWDFAAYTALVANTHYRLLSGGELYFSSGLIVGRDTLEVTYVAGIGANDAAVIAAAGDLALAADIQVCEEFRRKNNPTTASRPGPGGTSKTYTAPHGFLPRVIELLAPYRRILVEA